MSLVDHTTPVLTDSVSSNVTYSVLSSGVSQCFSPSDSVDITHSDTVQYSLTFQHIAIAFVWLRPVPFHRLVFQFIRQVFRRQVVPGGFRHVARACTRFRST